MAVITVHLLVLLCFLHVFAVGLDQLLAALGRDGNQPCICGVLRLHAVFVVVESELHLAVQFIRDLAVVTPIAVMYAPITAAYHSL